MNQYLSFLKLTLTKAASWICFCGIILSSSASATSIDKIYSLSIVPQYTPIFIHRNWQPFVERLEKDTGIKFQIKVYATFQKFLSSLERGEPDFTYLAPYHLVVARKAQGYEPLIRSGSHELIGIIVVPKQSTLKSAKDLDGKTITFPSPNAFAASLYMRAWLHKKTGINFTSEYAGTHDNVYRQVAYGLVDAGGGVNSTLSNQPDNLKNNLRVLYKLPAVAPHPLAAHPRVSNEIRHKIINSILNMTKDKAGKALLAALHFSQPKITNYKRDYYPLESLDLEKYQLLKQE